MEQERNGDGFDMVPKLTYSDEVGGARVRAQGVDCTVTAPMFELAEQHGSLSTTTDVPPEDLEALFGVELDQLARVTVTIEPVDEETDE